MRIILLFVVFILYSSFSLVFVQNKPQHRVTVKVNYAITVEAFPGVNIIIEGILIGTSRGSDGTYSIMVAGGQHVLL
ncbi:MAG: hypothetical protein D4R64_15625, partial [Porphyromonadaceae bacterium]